MRLVRSNEAKLKRWVFALAAAAGAGSSASDGGINMSTGGQKLYIGDAVSIEFDGHAFVLTTEDGISITNRIVLEPEVLETMRDYVDMVLGPSNARKRGAGPT